MKFELEIREINSFLILIFFDLVLDYENGHVLVYAILLSVCTFRQKELYTNYPEILSFYKEVAWQIGTTLHTKLKDDTLKWEFWRLILRFAKECFLCLR